MGVLADVSERRRAEEELRRRNEELLSLHETALGLIQSRELESVLTQIVTRAAALVGSPYGYIYLADAAGETLTVRFGAGDAGRFTGASLRRGEGLAGRVLETGTALAVDDYTTWDGRAATFDEVPFRAAAAVPLRAGGKLGGVLGVAHLDAERSFGESELALLSRFGQLASLALESARLNEELRRSAEHLERILESVPDGFVALDTGWRCTYASEPAGRILGRRREDLVGRNLWEEFPHEVGGPFHAACLDVLATQIPRDVEEADLATARWIANRIFPSGDGIAVHFRDVTERRHAEEELRTTTATLQAIVTAAPLAIIALDGDNRLTAWNPAAEQIFGWAAEEVLGREPRYIPAAETGRAGAMWADVRAGHTVTGFEAQRLRKDGSTFDASISAAPIRDAEGAVVGIMGLVADASERTRARQLLEEAEERYRTLVEQIPAVVYVTDADERGQMLYISPGVEPILGISPEEWTGEEVDLWLDVVHPDDRARTREAFLRTVRAGDPLDLEYRAISRDGHLRWFRDQGRVLPAWDGRPALLHGVMLDITEIKEAQGELERSLALLREADEERRRLLSRLVAAGEEERARVAADIHDDSVQRLTAVGLRIGMLRNLASNAQERAAVDQLEAEVGATIASLRRLLFQLRPRELDTGGLVAALRTTLAQAKAENGADYRLESDLQQEPPIEIRTIAYRIAQEALTNARKHARASTIEVGVETARGGLVVRVTDDGVGFDVASAEASARPGHLGLLAMRERAEFAGGLLEIRSAPGAGTTVELWLPL